MTNEQLIKELLDIEIWARGTAERAANLRAKLEGGAKRKKKEEDERMKALMTDLVAKRIQQITLKAHKKIAQANSRP